MTERDQIIARAKRIKSEIEQIFTDAASWNDFSKARKEGAEPIDPDPDGQLSRLLKKIDRMLDAEAKRHDHSPSISAHKDLF